MNKLAELKAALEATKKKGRDIIEAADAEDRELTDAEATEVAEITAEADKLSARITKEEALASARRTMEAATGGEASVDAIASSAYGQNTVKDKDPARTGGFASLDEFAVCVRQAADPTNAVIDPRLSAEAKRINVRQMNASPTNFHTGGGDAGEGFSLPPQFRDDIFEVMEGVDEFGPLVDEEPTDARKIEMLANEETPWGASGVQAFWLAEGAQMNPSKLDDQNRTVTLHKIAAFVLATEDLLADAPRLRSRMTLRAGQALAWEKNSAMMRGSGSGKPLGWLTSPALITVPKESGQAAATLNAQNLLKMYSRLSVLPGDTPLWLANRNTLPELATMTIGDQPVWLPPNGMAGAPNGFVLGAPLRFTEHAEALGGVGDIQLMSPRGYYSAVRDTGPSAESSIHLYFDFGIEAFRFMTRFGGQPHLSAPIEAPTEGGGASNSKSHFVTLAERA